MGLVQAGPDNVTWAVVHCQAVVRGWTFSSRAFMVTSNKQILGATSAEQT